MKLAVIIGDPKVRFLSWMTSVFTKCPAYHIAFVDEKTNMMYDMYWIRRRRTWPRYTDDQVMLFDIDHVTVEYLEEQLSTDTSEYGFLDYLMFAVKPIFHLFGKTTRNAGGVICSEMVNKDIIACGGTTPFPLDYVPNPCEFLSWLLHKDA